MGSLLRLSHSDTRRGLCLLKSKIGSWNWRTMASRKMRKKYFRILVRINCSGIFSFLERQGNFPTKEKKSMPSFFGWLSNAFFSGLLIWRRSCFSLWCNCRTKCVPNAVDCAIKSTNGNYRYGDKFTQRTQYFFFIFVLLQIQNLSSIRFSRYRTLRTFFSLKIRSYLA